MSTEGKTNFQSFNKNLLAPSIVDAEKECVRYDFLKLCTLEIAPSKGIQVGDYVSLSMDVEGVGGFGTYIPEVTREQVETGISIELSKSSLIPRPGALVTANYTVKKPDKSEARSATCRYTVGDWPV